MSRGLGRPNNEAIPPEDGVAANITCNASALCPLNLTPIQLNSVLLAPPTYPTRANIRLLRNPRFYMIKTGREHQCIYTCTALNSLTRIHRTAAYSIALLRLRPFKRGRPPPELRQSSQLPPQPRTTYQLPGGYIYLSLLGWRPATRTARYLPSHPLVRHWHGNLQHNAGQAGSDTRPEYITGFSSVHQGLPSTSATSTVGYYHRV